MSDTFHDQAMSEHLIEHFSAKERRLLNLARLSYADLCREICLFEDAVLEKSTIVDARLYLLPNFTDDDIGVQPSTIDFTPITGENALRLALEHQHSLKQEYGHSARIIKRLPGVIVLEHPEPDSLRARLVAINLKKNTFHADLLRECPDPDARFELLLSAMPNVVKLKAFRDLLFANRPLYSVGFSWKHRQSVQRFGKAQLMATLETNLSYYQKRFPLTNKPQEIAQEIEIISQYPATSCFIQARSLRVAPAMNLNYVKNTAKYIESASAPVDMIAHSPLFVFNQDVKIHPLKPYDVANAGASKVHGKELLLPRISVYFDAENSSAKAQEDVLS